MSSVQAYLQEHSDSLFADLRLLVSAESPSTDKRAVDACGEVLREIMAQRLGASVEVVPREAYGNHLVFTVGKGSKRTAILGHFDTVWDIGRLPMKIEDGKFYGPGVLDMKAGLVQAIWATKALIDLGLLNDREIRFLCSSDEELGSPSSREWIESEAVQCEQVLVVEPATSHTNALKIERKGTGRFDIKIKGRAAHAGNNPEDGVSAVHEMAEQILFLHGLNAPELGTTLNVGIAKGGQRTNVVADSAELSVDLRVSSVSEARRIEGLVNAMKPCLAGAQVSVTGGLVRPPLEYTPANQALFAVAQEAATALGIQIEGASVGGGSDGNFTSAVGVPTLDGLGATGVGPHAIHEHIIISDLPVRAALLAELIQRL
ncbi:acetylornithine deacetylase/succinyldiaminopimelate desuccinylase-like deacylase [Pseudomonas sp. GM84]|uniref:M20 family metallopeptidase n=1 Tax=Pseudomonas sp. GM84 TaxID=1144340 RepID=UPI00026FC6F8|nr:M20 family metallopeptidase [Pseudomonas sp. GM84]EJN39142.1 acetylornithine deacetylase/succinyldiaminopimelate desuccinylase-like deacylase [Pseudomonas sp. GM84]